MTVSAPLKSSRQWRLQPDWWAMIAAGAIILALLVGTLPVRWW